MDFVNNLFKAAKPSNASDKSSQFLLPGVPSEIAQELMALDTPAPTLEEMQESLRYLPTCGSFPPILLEVLLFYTASVSVPLLLLTSFNSTSPIFLTDCRILASRGYDVSAVKDVHLNLLFPPGVASDTKTEEENEKMLATEVLEQPCHGTFLCCF